MLVEPRDEALEEAEVVAPQPAPPPDTDIEGEDEQMPASPMSMQDGIHAVQQAFTQSAAPRWPMYVRQARQFLKNAIDGFDERQYGFASVVDLLRAAGKEGVLRIERDRQGAIRVFPGANLAPRPVAFEEPVVEDEDQPGVEVPVEPISAAAELVEPVGDVPIVDAEPVTVQMETEAEAAVGNRTGRGARKRKTAPATARSARTSKPARPANARVRKRGRASSNAAGKG
jgi:hypothetical protein